MRIILTLTILLTFVLSLSAQVEWKREKTEDVVPVELFHSTHAVNLPTAETIGKNELETEISHRFIPTIKSGSKDFWGFDGPVTNRLAIGYGITNNTQITFGRSNFDDNYDLSVKQKIIERDNEALPLMISIMGGAAWNTENQLVESSDSRAFQFYGQVIFNTMFGEKIALGVVPSYLYNSHLECEDIQYSFTIGTYIQYYLTDMFSLIAEYNPTITGWRQSHNPVGFGLEIETGGHFFKIFLSNSTDLNQSQFLAGADKSFNDGDLRFGFMITRLLFL